MSHADVPEEVRALERVLDQSWRDLPVFGLPREEVVHGLFDAFGHAVAINTGMTVATGGNELVLHDHVRRLIGGLRWSMVWCHAGDRVVLDKPPACQRTDFLAAIAHGAKYDDIADMFHAVGHDWAYVAYDADSNAATFTNRGRPSRDYLESLVEDLAGVSGSLGAGELVSRIRSGLARDPWWTIVRSSAAGQLSTRLRSGKPSPLPGEWDMGGYSLAEGRSAWFRLMGVAAVAWMAGDPTAAPTSWVVPRDTLTHQLAGGFRGGQVGAEVWLQDLTLAPGRHRSQPSIGITPFVDVDGRLFTSPELLSWSNWDRNVVRVLAQRRRGVWDGLKNEKEALFKREMEPVVRAAGWSWHGGFRIDDPLDGREVGDIDALMLDPTGGIVVLQLKWPIGADEVNELHDDEVEREFDVGREQASTAASWIQAAKSDLLRMKLGAGFDDIQIDASRVVSLVVSRTTVPQLRGRSDDERPRAVTWSMLRSVLQAGVPARVELLERAVRARVEELVDSVEEEPGTYKTVEVMGTRWRLPVAAIDLDAVWDLR